MSDLPPLPKPWDLQHDDAGMPQVLYTADQMREYALAAVAAERKRCAVIADEHGLQDADEHGCQGCGEMIAAAIRAR